MWDEEFCAQAMEFFECAGYTPRRLPLYENHSSKQAIYFDAEKSVALSEAQRDLLNDFGNVSLLFELNDNLFEEYGGERIAFYSLTLFDEAQRDQTVCDIHVMLQSTIETSASVVLSKCGDYMALSFAVPGRDCIISDWYHIDDDFERLALMIDVANVCVRTATDFFLDIIYCSARNLYCSNDFVEQEEEPIEIDEIVADDTVDEPFVENFNEGVEMSLFDDFLDDDTSVDDDEFAGIDEEILSDPLKMVEWLKNH